MATVETETRLARGENRVVIRNVGWQGYQTLLSLVGDQPVRITYDRGDVELMSPLLKHERNRSRLGRMVGVLTEELRIPTMSAGATTLKREDLDRGLEADESFYLANAHRIRGKKTLDMRIDPPPDLTIEAVYSHAAEAALEVYRRLGVPEVWIADQTRLAIQILDANNHYHDSPQSLAFPFVSAEEIHAWTCGGRWSIPPACKECPARP